VKQDLYDAFLLAAAQLHAGNEAGDGALLTAFSALAGDAGIGLVEEQGIPLFDCGDYDRKQAVEVEKGVLTVCPRSGCHFAEEDLLKLQTAAGLLRLSAERKRAVSAGADGQLSAQPAEIKEETRQLLRDVRDGMEKREFYAYYQPKVDIRTNALIGAEALVRWIRDGKMVMPGAFIPALEETGMICELDLYIFERVCADIRRWQDEGLTVSTISSNFSMRHLGNPDFTDTLITIANRYGVDYGHLEIELTETMNAEEERLLLETVRRLRGLGFRTALDDFGSGYSSLSLVKEIPVDVIKLDKSLLSAQHDFTTLRNNDKALMMHMVGLTKDMQMMSLAEGVETAEQKDFLKSIGCNYVQGFLFDRPLAPEVFRERLVSGGYKEMPTEKEAPAPAPKKEEKAAEGGFSGKLLLAEDNAINREITTGILEALGAEVDAAVDGKDALEHFMRSGVGEYAAILMDIQMPVMDGYQSSTAIRALERADAKTVPIIAITVDTYKETREQAEQSGMNGYVTKPLDLSRLSTLLEGLGKSAE